MKKYYRLLLTTALLFVSIGSRADDSKLDLSLPKDLFKQNQDIAVKSVSQKIDENGHIYYDVSLEFPLVPIPVDLTAAIGATTNNHIFEAEVFAGLRVARFLYNDEGGTHIPYGARVRIALDSARTVFVEYQYQDISVSGNSYGLHELKNLFSIINYSNDRKTYFGCGYGRDIHHAWANETHAPEEGGMISCRVGKKFR